MTNKTLFAEWIIEVLPTNEDIEGLHISHGYDDDDQQFAFDMNSKGATVTIKPQGIKYLLRFECDAPEDVASNPEHWFSPCYDDENIEARDWGISEGGKVIISIEYGMTEITQKPDNIKVEIINYDVLESQGDLDSDDYGNDCKINVY
jgi:hypothetical protein